MRWMKREILSTCMIPWYAPMPSRHANTPKGKTPVPNMEQSDVDGHSSRADDPHCKHIRNDHSSDITGKNSISVKDVYRYFFPPNDIL